jgi:tetratricopeptide (TPR) repeat protein
LPIDSDVPDLWPPPGALPPGCYLVLSARPGVRAATESGLRRVRSVPEHFRELRVGPAEPEHRAVLRSYAVKRLARPRPDGQGPLPAAWVEPLIDQAGGSFLYVFHYCRALHFGVYSDLAQLPPPAAYYPAFFQHLCGRVGEHLFKGYYARALALIAVAREPVGLTHLEAWGLERSKLIVILDDLADLLRSRREPWDAETLYTLGHDAVRRFLTEGAEWKPRLARANRELAKLAVRRFGKDWSAVDPFNPVERYLLLHLLDHATEPEVRAALLADATLATACQEHGSALWERHEFEPCLVACDMAVRLREDQVRRQGSRELRAALVRAYVNRGNVLDSLGRPAAALDDGCLAVNLCADLVLREGRDGLRDYLARAHVNRGLSLVHLHRPKEALADYRTSIALYEALVCGEGRHELRSELATAYGNRAGAVAALGRLDEALTDYGTSIRLAKEAMDRTSDRALGASLASTYSGRGSLLWELGRVREALTDFNSAIDLYEGLVHRDSRRELLGLLGMSYMNRGNALAHLESLEEALSDYGKCIALEEELIYREGRRGLRYELALAYMNRGVQLADLRRWDESLADLGRCISLREELVLREGRRELREHLAVAYMNRGRCMKNAGRLEEASVDYVYSLRLYEELVRGEDRRELLGDLAWASTGYAHLLLVLGRREEACDRAREALSILQAELARTGWTRLGDALELAELVVRSACY